MVRSALLLLLFALALQAPAKAAVLRPAQIEASNPAFEKAIREFNGKALGGYEFNPPRLLSDDVLAYVAVPGLPAPVETLPDGRRILFGSPPHAGFNHGAVLLSKDGAVEAEALLYYRCPIQVCRQPTLAVILGPTTNEAAALAAFRSWLDRHRFQTWNREPVRDTPVEVRRLPKDALVAPTRPR